MTTVPASIGASGALPPSAQAPAPAPTTEQTSTPLPPKPYYDFTVTMTCGSCSGAVERVLAKQIAEPNKFKVDLASQKVYVWGPSLPPFEEVKKKIEKTGKKIKTADEVKA